MNLVEQKEKYIKDREDLIKQRDELIAKLKEVEVSIERYNGAIIAITDVIKNQEGEATDSPETPKMKIKK